MGRYDIRHHDDDNTYADAKYTYGGGDGADGDDNEYGRGVMEIVVAKMASIRVA